MACRGPFDSHHVGFLWLPHIVVAASGQCGVPLGSKRRSAIGIAMVGLVPADVS